MGMYQECVIDCVHELLKWRSSARHADEKVMKEIMKDALDDLIRHYPEYFELHVEGSTRRQVHIWTRHLQGFMLPYFFRPFVMSSAAYEIVMRQDLAEIRDGETGVYQEHITPVNFVFNRLMKLDPGHLSRVVECFDQCRLVLLACSENEYLDRGARFSQQDVDLLATQVEVSDDERSYANECIGTSCKSEGSGLLRMCKLYNENVHFVDKDGNEIPPNQWRSCLAGSHFVIQ